MNTLEIAVPNPEECQGAACLFVTLEGDEGGLTHKPPVLLLTHWHFLWKYWALSVFSTRSSTCICHLAVGHELNNWLQLCFCLGLCWLLQQKCPKLGSSLTRDSSHMEAGSPRSKCRQTQRLGPACVLVLSIDLLCPQRWGARGLKPHLQQCLSHWWGWELTWALAFPKAQAPKISSPWMLRSIYEFWGEHEHYELSSSPFSMNSETDARQGGGVIDKEIVHTSLPSVDIRAILSVTWARLLVCSSDTDSTRLVKLGEVALLSPHNQPTLWQ